MDNVQNCGSYTVLIYRRHKPMNLEFLLQQDGIQLEGSLNIGGRMHKLEDR
jgi:hypothetical protein